MKRLFEFSIVTRHFQTTIWIKWFALSAALNVYTRLLVTVDPPIWRQLYAIPFVFCCFAKAIGQCKHILHFVLIHMQVFFIILINGPICSYERDFVRCNILTELYSVLL